MKKILTKTLSAVLLCSSVFANAAWAEDAQHLTFSVPINSGYKNIQYSSYGDYWITTDSNDKYGIIKTDGTVTVPFEYDELFGNNYQHTFQRMYGNRIGAEKDGKYGIIDYNGNVIFPIEYKGIYNPDMYYYYDVNNKQIKECFTTSDNKYFNYDGQEVEPIDKINDTLFIKKDGEEYTVMKTTGENIFSFSSSSMDAYTICDNLILINKNDEYDAYAKAINFNGEYVLSEYSTIQKLEDDRYKVSKNGQTGIVDGNGNIIVPLQSKELNNLKYDSFIEEEKLERRDDGYYQVYDLWDVNGNVIISHTITKKRDVSDGFGVLNGNLIRIVQDGKYGIMDKYGNIVVPCQYTKIETDWKQGDNSIFIVGDDNKKVGAIDQAGNIIIPIEYDGVFFYNKDTIGVKKDGMGGILNSKGDIVLPIEYKNIIRLAKDRFIVEKDDKKGIVDSSNNEISPMIYDGIYWAYSYGMWFYQYRKDLDSHDIYVVQQGDKYGIISKYGKELIPCEYNYDQIGDAFVDNGTLYCSLGTDEGWGIAKVYDPQLAEDVIHKVIFTIGEHNSRVFGKLQENDVAPIIRNNRTMLPARAVAESLGGTVGWDENNKAVTVNGKNKNGEDVSLVINIGSDTAYVNGEAVTLDSPAFIENNRTYTPVRFIAENLGADVSWDEDNQRVILEKNQ